MRSPKLNSRRTFWLLVVFSLVWSISWGASSGDVSKQSVGAWIQDVFARPINVLLTPGRAMLWRVQLGLDFVVNRTRFANENEATVEQLREQIQILQNINRTNTFRIQDLQNRLNLPRGLTMPESVSARVVSPATGAGVNLLQIRVNENKSVAPGMPVVAHEAVIGRIETVGAAGLCDVRLITDPRMKIQAILVRDTANGVERVAPEPYRCLVEGLGNGRMVSANLPAEAAPLIKEGDILELADRAWPENTDYMPLGEVIAVGRNEQNIQRYKLTIAPRVNFNTLTTVWVVLTPVPR